jgi:hypothetical protein
VASVKVRAFIIQVVVQLMLCSNDQGILCLLRGCKAIMEERIINHFLVLLYHRVVVADGEGTHRDHSRALRLYASEVPEDRILATAGCNPAFRYILCLRMLQSSALTRPSIFLDNKTLWTVIEMMSCEAVRNKLSCRPGCDQATGAHASDCWQSCQSYPKEQKQRISPLKSHWLEGCQYQ